MKLSNQFKQVAFIALCSSCLLLILVQDLTSLFKRSRQFGAHSNETRTTSETKQETIEDAQFGPFKERFLLTNSEIDKLGETSYRQVIETRNLLHLIELSYPIEPSSSVECDRERKPPGDEPGWRLLVMVNSKWSNTKRRQRVRASWLNKAALERAACRLPGRPARIEFAFVLGEPDEEEEETSRISNRQAIITESNKHRDLLVLGGLADEYRSLSLKHLSMFKWLIERQAASGCRSLVLKCDDDANVDLNQLLRKLEPASALAQTSGSAHLLYDSPVPAPASELDTFPEQAPITERSNWIMCARFAAHTRVIRRPDRKWRLSKHEYPFDTFPAYCSGLAYLAPLGLLKRLLVLAHLLHTKEARERKEADQHAMGPLWVDDVYVTGVLAASLADPLEVVRLNAHFCYTMALQSRRAKLGAPCMVSEEPDLD